MTSDPVAVREDASVVEAFDLMMDRGVRHLPVVADEGSVVGILSIDDLRGAFPFDMALKRMLRPAERHQLLECTVDEAMTWVPQTTHPDAPLGEAARCLAENRIGCLPVVDEGGRLVGILSETDALRALGAALRGEALQAGPAGGVHGLVDELWAERQRLVRELDHWQQAERALSADIREEPRDSADRAIDEREVARLEPISGRASRRLRAIEVALERAEGGRFGICERCQGHIPVTRLRAIPETTLCVRCVRTEGSEHHEGREM
jgi:CBS domain-containing protein/RNA polymerase-binding transcription factor DksA